MEISALKPHVKASDLPIEKLAANPNITDAEKVGQACRQFEAVFLRQIFQETRKTVIQSSLNHDSAISGIYGDMVNAQLADSISRSGAFGLAKSLQTQLVHQVLPQAGDASLGRGELRESPAGNTKIKATSKDTQPHKTSKI